jgi:predicted nuclease of restriction endonuclease-like RecB superfamily
MIVTFENVGRGKKTWQADIRELSYAELKKAVKKAGAIISRYPEFEVNDNERTGAIVCGFRTCGTFRW